MEDPDYNLVYLEEETSLQYSAANSASTSGTGNNGNEGGESTVAKLQVKRNSSTTEESDGSSSLSTGVKHIKRPSQSQQQISNDNQDSSSNSCESNENEPNNDEPALKRSKTETEDSTSQVAGTINKNNQELSSTDKLANAATTQHHEHSQRLLSSLQFFYVFITLFVHMYIYKSNMSTFSV